MNVHFRFQKVESCRVGMRKPDPRIYEHTLQQLNVRAEEAVFLDDLGQNCKAAAQQGIKAIRVRSQPIHEDSAQNRTDFLVVTL